MGEEQAAPKPAEAAAAALELTGFVMSAEDAERRAAAAGVATVQDLLPLLIPSARKRAQVPISDFQVGAVGLGASGRVYVGVNLEFRGVPLCHSVHAEQFLVANAAAAGGVRAARRRRLPHALRPLPPVPLGDPHRGGHAEQGLAPEWRTVASLLLHPFEAHNDALGDPVVAAAANGVAPGDLDACGGASREGITGLGRTVRAWRGSPRRRSRGRPPGTGCRRSASRPGAPGAG